MAPVEFGVLGPVRVIADDGTSLTAPQLRRLLGLLLTRPNQPVPIGVLTDALWPDAVDTAKRLQVLVFRLRKELGDADRIGFQRGGYAVRVGPDELDAQRFEARIREGLALSERQALAKALREALALWRSEPFADAGEAPILADEATRLTELRLSAQEQLYAAELDDDRTDAASLVAELHQLAAQHPFHERFQALLMIALFRANRQVEALEIYRSMRTRLVDELGIEPGPDLRRVQASILAGERPTVAEQQGQAPGGGLPPDESGFVGREHELAELDAVVSGGSRLVVLSGAPGVGKTALAVRWAHRVADRFPGGQLYVNLRGHGPGEPMSPAAALAAILADLGVRGQQLPEGLSARTGLLRSLLADRSALLILDNAADPGQVRPLLPANGLVVVTSRRQLRGLVASDGARRLVVEPLEPATAARLLRAAAPGATAVDRLVSLCGGLPLALTIAADLLARRPGQAASLLSDRADTAPLEVLDAARLRSIFSWSYDALSAEDATMFRLIGLHPGPDLSLPAASALSGVALRAARGSLDRLLDAHLLEQRRPGHYEQHDLLRAYARELAEQSPASGAGALDRLHRWYLHSAANARRAMGRGVPLYDFGAPADVIPLEFTSSGQASAWFEAERHALMAVVIDATERGRHLAAYAIAHMVWVHLLQSHHLDDAASVHRFALAAAEAAGDHRALATSESQLGTTHMRRGDYDRAAAHASRAVEHWTAAGHTGGQAAALGNLGAILQAAGRYDEALERQTTGLRLAEQAGHLDRQTHLLNNLAMTLVSLKRYDDAVAACRRALRLTDDPDAGQNIRPHLLDTLGLALTAHGSPTEAVDVLGEALGLFRDVPDPWHAALILAHLGVAQEASDRPGSARDSYTEAVSILEELQAVDNEELSRADLVERLARLG